MTDCRCHRECCVKACSKETLKPVQTWLLGVSAMRHYTIFGIAPQRVQIEFQLGYIGVVAGISVKVPPISTPTVPGIFRSLSITVFLNRRRWMYLYGDSLAKINGLDKGQCSP